MSTSTSSPSRKPRIFKVATDGKIYCNHDMVAICRVAGNRSTRPSHAFYGCPLWPSMDCKFFIWKEDVDAIFAGHEYRKVLELRNNALEIKIANLEVEKMMLEEENKNLKLKMAKSTFVSKKYYIICIVIVVYLLSFLY
ncbi:hypothetical protein QVD17_14303 [Tagetes erecta]|uniref:Zinc finger GRF-type domain-containing protein n=1 Tax=Tagetes erecta TaxID=13708 RepID=A0AAD8KY19_TARER|nr:hypothetical protein QVD17_14303 [Tagetes erecta]